jgi:hypothetical protein
VREPIRPLDPECFYVKDPGHREPEGSRSGEGFDGVWLRLRRTPPGYKVSESALLVDDSVGIQGPPCCLLCGGGNKGTESEEEIIEIPWALKAGASFLSSCCHKFSGEQFCVMEGSVGTFSCLIFISHLGQTLWC